MNCKSCTEANDKKWKSKSCQEIVSLHSIINSFHENPDVPPNVCASFSRTTANSRMLRFRYKVIDILNEAHKQMIVFNKSGMLFEKFIDTVSAMLFRLNTALLVNQDSLQRRTRKPTEEKRHADCPHILLKAEKMKLKDFGCLLQVELQKLRQHYKKMELAQLNMSEFVKYARKSTKGLERRFKTTRVQFHNSLYCPYELEKLNFGEKDMDSLLYNFCGRLCEMEVCGEEGRVLMQCSKARVEEVWTNKKIIFEAVHHSLQYKLIQLEAITTALTCAIRTNNIYKKHMLRRLEKVSTLLESIPACDHLIEYVEETTCKLNKLQINDRKLKKDKDEKVEAFYTDNSVLHNRVHAKKEI